MLENLSGKIELKEGRQWRKGDNEVGSSRKGAFRVKLGFSIFELSEGLMASG
jgi:hypothetical protein